MKRTNPSSKPVLSICLIVRNAAPTLERCLKSLRERAPEAEIVIVDTMSNDYPTPEETGRDIIRGLPKTVAIAKRYADVWEEYRGPKGTWTREMYAFDDAASARNYSFALAHGRWLWWVDADDEVPGPEEVTRILKLNGRFAPPASKVIHTPQQVFGIVELLEQLEKDFPDIEGLWAPYLYESDEHGVAKSWQTRERIVRNNGHWTWRRPAHEVLVPVKPEYHAKMKTHAHLLHVHLKKFTTEDSEFSLRRHHAILKKVHESGEANCQDYLYLENFSQFLEPQLRKSYLDLAYEKALTPIDRARVQVRAGNWAREQGFFMDALEAYSAAVALAPECPDGHFGGAFLLETADRWLEAAQWYRRGTECPPAHPFSDVAPRRQALEFRLMGAMAFMEAARRMTSMKHPDGTYALDEGIAAANESVKMARAAVDWPGIAHDADEASMWLHLFTNERDGLVRMRELHEQWKYLVANDETQKAMKVLDLVPHNQHEHPIINDLKKWAATMRKHLTQPAAYADFYEHIDQIGCVASKEEALTFETTEPRARFLATWLKNVAPSATVLEVGSFDGNIAIPVMRHCPDIKYTALEATQASLDRFAERAKRFGLDDRLELVHGALSAEKNPLAGRKFDVVVCFEVIEHVPDPGALVDSLKSMLKPASGRLFLSTPWGAFDRGHSFNAATRDPRGHVRAMMPKDLIRCVEREGMRVEELGGSHNSASFGDTMHMRAQNIDYAMCRKAEFVVPSALWDWNASHVMETGIGASEETIVYLARSLARSHDVTVRGPLPKANLLYEEEVVDSVKYHPRESFGDINPHATVVVSRAPAFGTMLDELVGHRLDKVLWLQDASYADLTPEVAEKYRRVVVLSEWHKQAMHDRHQVPLDKMEVIPNFLLPEQFLGKGPKREPHRFIYCSSPDRGLVTLLKMWPAILERYPDATLGIFYGWAGAMKLGGLNPDWNAVYRPLRQQYLALRHQKGIEEYGRVNHERIALEMRRASVWPYPTHFEETYCSNALKARAAGCVPVCTPLAALNESAMCPQTRYVERLPDDFEAWTKAFVEGVVMAVETSDAERQKMSDEAIAAGRIGLISERWRSLI